jgi:hypothetical protein
LPKGRPARSRRLLTAPPPGCPRDDSVRRRSKSIHRTVARTMLRPRVEAACCRLVSRPVPSTSSSTLARSLLAVTRAKNSSSLAFRAVTRAKASTATAPPRSYPRVDANALAATQLTCAAESIAPASSRGCPHGDSNALGVHAFHPFAVARARTGTCPHPLAVFVRADSSGSRPVSRLPAR